MPPEHSDDPLLTADDPSPSSDDGIPPLRRLVSTLLLHLDPQVHSRARQLLAGLSTERQLRRLLGRTLESGHGGGVRIVREDDHYVIEIVDRSDEPTERVARVPVPDPL